MTKGREAGDFEIAFFEGVLKNRPDYVDALIPLAEAYTRKGMYEKGLEADLRLAQLCPEDGVAHYNLACSYALTSQPEKALQTLLRAVKLGWTDFAHMAKDKDLVSLHKIPQFIKLLASRDSE